jgi:hypothetical protein
MSCPLHIRSCALRRTTDEAVLMHLHTGGAADKGDRRPPAPAITSFFVLFI